MEDMEINYFRTEPIQTGSKYNIVTCCDKRYLPGVIALYNSVREHCKEEYDFWVFCHGEREDFYQITDFKGMRLSFNTQLPNNPSSSNWAEEIPAMYSRILIPNCFQELYERSLYMDADTIVLTDLNELFDIDMEGYCIAGTLNGNPWNVTKQKLQRQMEVWDYPDADIRNIDAIQAGVLLFDNKKWMEQKMTDEVIDVIADPLAVAKYVVQGYLGVALMGDFKKIPYEWNVDVSWRDMCMEGKNAKILHYIGGGKKMPWKEGSNYTFANHDYVDDWKKYYNNGELK